MNVHGHFLILFFHLTALFELVFHYLIRVKLSAAITRHHAILVEDNKQRFEVIIIPRDLSKVVLKLAHDDLGHNGAARTYMIIRRNYCCKGLRPDVVHYVKRCTVCRKYNSASPKYNKGTFQAPGAPMDFISMDLIGEFHPPSLHRNKYALTVICMLSGWTW